MELSIKKFLGDFDLT